MQILLADDDPKVRSALHLILDQNHGFQVIGEAEDSDEMLVKINELNPDMVLLDWELPGIDPTETTIEKIRNLCPHIQIIALSGDTKDRKNALLLGVNSFVCKSDPPDRLIFTIENQE